MPPLGVPQMPPPKHVPCAAQCRSAPFQNARSRAPSTSRSSPAPHWVRRSPASPAWTHASSSWVCLSALLLPHIHPLQNHCPHPPKTPGRRPRAFSTPFRGTSASAGDSPNSLVCHSRRCRPQPAPRPVSVQPLLSHRLFHTPSRYTELPCTPRAANSRFLYGKGPPGSVTISFRQPSRTPTPANASSRVPSTLWASPAPRPPSHTNSPAPESGTHPKHLSTPGLSI